MAFKNFRLRCALRVLLIGLSLYACIYLFFNTSYRATPLVAALAVAYQLYSLIHYVEKTNRDLSRFLLSIRHADFSQSFSSRGLGTSFDDLREAFGEVFAAFRRERAEKEENYRYLQTVVQHIGIGLIVYQRDGQVDLINNAARRLLGLAHLKNVQALADEFPHLLQALRQLQPKQKRLVRIEIDGETQQLSIHATAFRMHEREYLLASLQNIHGELEEKEMEAWQNLIRVLTHEIMNSITPISSLAATSGALLEGEGSIDDETLSDVRESVRTIHRRSDGLLHFVQSYRSLTHLPQPQFQTVAADDVCQRVTQLLRAEFAERAIDFSYVTTTDRLELTADPELVEQVLINLLRNALQAVTSRDQAKVVLQTKVDGQGRPVIEVVDNGPGIVEEARDKIFIPFFTTKQGGSGIGLSLCRQIMRLHGGHISARSEPDVETVFTLRF